MASPGNQTILVTGGCKSGKSRHALKLANHMAKNRKVFLATCVPLDDEMKDRVRRHRFERGNDWLTVESPIHVADAIRNHSQAGVILLDCLTLWMSNVLIETGNQEKTMEHVDGLMNTLKEATCPIILVTNEVGAGIVPENPLARSYRDAVGIANQKIAGVVDRVDWVVAGIPVTIKPELKIADSTCLLAHP